MEQLKMVRDDAPIDEICFPHGFYMRPYKEGDGIGWCKCCIDGSLGVNEISEEVFEEKMLHDKSVNPANIFFLISASGEIAGTVTYQYADEKDAGYVHMVAIQKDYLGQRLALPMNLYAVKRILEDGKRKIYLTTDDWRLPAIKTYLNAGFVPVICQPDMEARWGLVLGRLRSAY